MDNITIAPRFPHDAHRLTQERTISPSSAGSESHTGHRSARYRVSRIVVIGRGPHTPTQRRGAMQPPTAACGDRLRRRGRTPARRTEASPMSPRLTDWTLALTGALAFATGVVSLFSGRPDQWLVFAAHGVAGLWLALLLWGKLRRVLPRL